MTDLHEASAKLGWAPDTQGRLTLMAPYYRESVWHDMQKLDGLFVVSTLQLVLDQKPEILNHNIESVPRLYKVVRPQAKYHRSLKLLQIAKQQGLTTKTGMMLGLGEEQHEIDSVIHDLVAISCDILTLGQYLQPTAQHLKVERWVHPDEFAAWKTRGEQKGLRHVESGPLVRSSYHAEKQVQAHAALT